MEYDVAFEGGGAKGVVFVGALKEFEARGHTARRFVGTSAGAIAALLMAAGYSASDLDAALDDRLPDGRSRMATFLDVPDQFSGDDVEQSTLHQLLSRIDLPLVPARTEQRLERALIDGLLSTTTFRILFSMLEKGGPFAGDRLRTWLHDRLEDRQPGLGGAGFAEFARLTGRDLSITVSDVTGEEMLVLNARTAPTCPVVWATRASMSLPFVFQEVVWRREWGSYRGRDISGHVLIDGGVLSNFPIRLLSSKLDEVREIMGDIDPTAVPNLGLLIDEGLAVAGAGPARGPLTHLWDLKPLHRLERIIETLLHAHDRAIIEACMAMGEICRLPARGYSALEFGMNGDRRRALIEAGRRAMRDYFDRGQPGG